MEDDEERVITSDAAYSYDVAKLATGCARRCWGAPGRRAAIARLGALAESARAAIASLPACCDEPSFTYILAAERLVKIGHSVDVPERVLAIQQCSPVHLKLIHVMRGGDAERLLHLRLQRWREHGEWFRSEALADIAGQLARSRRLGECMGCMLRLGQPGSLAWRRHERLRSSGTDMQPTEGEG